MTHVLLMPALQIRDPVPVLVLVKAYDLPFQCLMISIVVISDDYST
jgi:hypothetical protein